MRKLLTLALLALALTSGAALVTTMTSAPARATCQNGGC
jgi:hypothetical protein